MRERIMGLKMERLSVSRGSPGMSHRSQGEEEGVIARGPDLREQLTELLVFLFLILPPLVLSTLEVRHSSLPFPLAATATILDDLALVALILFFLWRNREPLARIGWTRQGLPENIILGVLLFVPLFIGAGILGAVLSAAGIPSIPATPSFLQFQGLPGAALALVLVIVVAISEETVFRGYLVPRLQAVTSSSWAAVLISSAIFSVGHGYEGATGVIITGVIGVVYALLYLSRRSLVAPVVLHFLQDFTTILLLPLLGIH
jgi:membrane protease YdiL (CAAX protease family)